MAEQKIGVGFGVMIMKGRKVLLGLRNEDAVKASSALHGEGTWTMPGGKLHFGETHLDGCVREVMEETGAKIDKSKLRLISLANDIMPDVHFVTAGFLYEGDFSDANVMEPDEIVEWRWFDLDKLPTKIFSASQKVLDNYSAGTIYGERGEYV